MLSYTGIDFIVPNNAYSIAKGAFEHGQCLEIQLKGVESWKSNIEDKFDALKIETEKQHDANSKQLKIYMTETNNNLNALVETNAILLSRSNNAKTVMLEMCKKIDEHEKVIDDIIDFLQVSTTNISNHLNVLSKKVGIEEFKFDTKCIEDK